MSTTFVTYNWAEPDPQTVAQQLIEVARELEDLREPMLLAGELTRQDIQENFDTESDPSGTGWAGWAKSYEPWARAHGNGQILNLSGDLKGAATSPGAFVATDQGLFLDTSGLPEYWAWNNFGAERSAPGTSTANKAFRKANRGNIGGFGELRGENYLPERPFIGLSPEAREKIDAVFGMWFEQSIHGGGGRGGKGSGRHNVRGGNPANRGQFSKRI